MKVLRSDGTIGWGIVRVAALLVLNMLAALPVAGWSWLWATFPVNDGVAPRMTDADWTHHAIWEAGKTLVRAVILFGMLSWVNRRVLRPSEHRPATPYLIAGAAAIIVLLAGWRGVLEFVRERPIF